jgi:hypothetical protein
MSVCSLVPPTVCAWHDPRRRVHLSPHGRGLGRGASVGPVSSATITASYLEDALGVLLEAVGVVLEGADEARCSWEEEPGEYRWIFERAGSDVHLRVLAFRDVYTRDPDGEGVVVFETRQPLREMATAVADGAQAVLDEYGADEYRRRWVDFPFPLGHLEVIRAHLGAE